MSDDTNRRKFPSAIPNPALSLVKGQANVSATSQDLPDIELDLTDDSLTPPVSTPKQPSAALPLPASLKKAPLPGATTPAPPKPTKPNVPLPNVAKPAQPPALKTAPLPTPGTRAPQPTVKMPDLGPINPIMKDPEVTEIMINDVRNIVIEKAGKLYNPPFSLKSMDELQKIVRAILEATGRVISPDQPYLDTVLPDGSRVNIVAPPLTVNGPCVTIRRFPVRSLASDDLIQRGMFDAKISQFLSAVVQGRLNLVISGGTGSGKTTLLNALIASIPRNERVITIEDTLELTLPHPNSVRMQTQHHSPTHAAVSARDLVANSLRMRPDRIIVGECRKEEAFDMLQAMNTGHSGSMTTVHANSPRDALSRLETLCMLAGTEIPMLAIRKQMASAIDLIIHIKRTRNNKRRILAVTELTGMEGETITLQDIFSFELETERFKCTGFVPTFLDRLKENGIELPRHFFA